MRDIEQFSDAWSMHTAGPVAEHDAEHWDCKQLVIVTAMLVAEIERMDREELAAKGESKTGLNLEGVCKKHLRFFPGDVFSVHPADGCPGGKKVDMSL